MYRQFIEQVLDVASAVARDKFGKVSTRYKESDPHQVLTEADTAIGKLLLRYTWVIDPIDGTSNFAAGLPHYGIMVLEDATPIAGGIALPAFGEIYSAQKGEGATCNGAPIHVAGNGGVAGRMLCYGIDADPAHPEVARAS
ncbi:hypothetical protein OHA25_58775 [Nonomuraea sp. NBC_00507]|uniref:inositol monophosphatase family protein n=1 Tax=Nonomuraea sp. NBC_00507 TaxID=2976002 RepID=UPI002E179CA7